jgi:hypothetical protein
MTEFRNRRRRRDQAGWLLEDPRLLHCHHNPRRFIVKGQESHTLEMPAIAFLAATRYSIGHDRRAQWGESDGTSYMV